MIMILNIYAHRSDGDLKRFNSPKHAVGGLAALILSIINHQF